MLISEDALYQIIEDTWNSTLGFQVERPPESKPLLHDALTVRVKITGAWEGEVRLQCPVPLARLIAAASFQVDAEKVEKDEILDALSELVHIVGGNLKPLLPSPVTLSLPTPSDQTEGTQVASPCPVLSRLPLQSRGYPFLVTLAGRVRQ